MSELPPNNGRDGRLLFFFFFLSPQTAGKFWTLVAPIVIPTVGHVASRGLVLMSGERV